MVNIGEFKENVDSWIKDINTKVERFSEISSRMNETEGNTEHNYELIYELKDELEELKEEVKTLKILHLISIKKKMPLIRN